MQQRIERELRPLRQIEPAAAPWHGLQPGVTQQIAGLPGRQKLPALEPPNHPPVQLHTDLRLGLQGRYKRGGIDAG